jgi:hypothetical protein
MNQIWNILWKDVRHYWREISASIALLVAFGWNEVYGWTYREEFSFASRGLFTYKFLSGLVDVLLPVAWAFLIVRVIQGESLVGDRQFWLTRPYEWKKLLAAKLAFLLMFINFPLFILDIFLLSKAGFSPTKYVVGFLWMQMMILLFFILPATALAAVTATVVQALLATVIIALYMVGMVALSEYIPNSNFSGPADTLSSFLLIGVCLAVTLLQYARRKTSLSRFLIVSLGGAVLLLVVATPYRAIVAREYPALAAGQQPPFRLSILPAEKGVFAEKGKDVNIQMPLSVAGLTSESIVEIDAISVVIDAPDGLHWDSAWKSPGLSVFPEQKSTNVNFTLKRKLFERMESSVVKVRILVAFTLFHVRHGQGLIVPSGKFNLADEASCSVRPGYIPTLSCLAPLRRPSLMITTDVSANTCPLESGESPSKPHEIERDWMRNGSDPAEFGISPVQTFDVYLSTGHGRGICEGTPLDLSRPGPVLSEQITIQQEGVHLADYREKRLQFTVQ